eukprot:15458475-Alexandrium_andersonii.AAC.1
MGTLGIQGWASGCDVLAAPPPAHGVRNSESAVGGSRGGRPPGQAPAFAWGMGFAGHEVPNRAATNELV